MSDTAECPRRRHCTGMSLFFVDVLASVGEVWCHHGSYVETPGHACPEGNATCSPQGNRTLEVRLAEKAVTPTFAGGGKSGGRQKQAAGRLW